MPFSTCPQRLPFLPFILLTPSFLRIAAKSAPVTVIPFPLRLPLFTPSALRRNHRLTFKHKYKVRLFSRAPIPSTTTTPQGPVYQIQNYGDILRQWVDPPQFDVFGTLAVYDILTGNTARLQKLRWIGVNVIEGMPFFAMLL